MMQESVRVAVSIRLQILGAPDHPRENVLKKVKSQSKLTSNIIYYPVFQTITKIFARIAYSFIDKSETEILPGYLCCRFRYGKALGDNLVRTNSPNIEKAGRPESCEKMDRQVCDFIFNSDTFSNKVCAKKMKRSEDLAF